MLRSRILAVPFLAAAAVTFAQTAPPELVRPATPDARSDTLLFVPEGNRLRVYDTGSLEENILIPSVGDALGSDAIPNARGRDINGQVCSHVVDVAGEPRLRIVTGEDSKDDLGERPGWGYIEVTGTGIDALDWAQKGKLEPHYAGAPDNHGCAFLSNGNLLTGAIGDTLPGQPATGEVILWFADGNGAFEQGFQEHVKTNGAVYTSGTVPYCKLDVRLATTGGFYVGQDAEGKDVLYVAANRPDDDGNPGGIFRYQGDFPTGLGVGEGCERTVTTPVRDSSDAIIGETEEPFVDEGRLTKTLFIPSSTSLTPSSITGSRRRLLDPATMTELETLYVSSVFTGTVAEYDANGLFLRYVLVPPGPLPVGQVLGVTPFGLALDSERRLYVADLGIVLAFPVGGFGSVVRVPFLETAVVDAATIPLPPELIRGGLTFPDGIGIANLP